MEKIRSTTIITCDKKCKGLRLYFKLEIVTEDNIGGEALVQVIAAAVVNS